MKIQKALKREKKIWKKKHGMRIVGKSVFLLVECQIKRKEANK